jgi:hypothetical protein
LASPADRRSGEAPLCRGSEKHAIACSHAGSGVLIEG